MSTAPAENGANQLTVLLIDTGNVDPEYQDTVTRAKCTYVAMTELALMGIGVMEQACVETFDLSPEAIGMAYMEVATEGRVIPAPLVMRETAGGQMKAAPIAGARWTKGPNMYPLSRAEIAMRASILNLAAVKMSQSEYPHHPIYQQTSDSHD